MTKREPKAPRYGYDLWYHAADHDPDTRHQNPTECGGTSDTAAERDARLDRYIRETLTPQGYTLYRVVLYTQCGRCDGSGEILVKPRGRKRAPWWLCKHQTCPDCHGNPRTTTNDTAVMEAAR